MCLTTRVIQEICGYLKKKKKPNIFFTFFHSFCIVWNWFIAKIYFIFVKQFVLRPFKMIANQTVTQFWTEFCHQIFGGWECKPCKIYRRMCSVYREACFSLKMFTQQLNMGLPLLALVEKTVNGVETHRLSGKEKVLGTAVSKEGDAYRLLGYDWSHHYWFLWKSCNCQQRFLLPSRFLLQNLPYLLNDTRILYLTW